jgi:mannose-6-phosphate isomerase-like protein (cupin superfamily)
MIGVKEFESRISKVIDAVASHLDHSVNNISGKISEISKEISSWKDITKYKTEFYKNDALRLESWIESSTDILKGLDDVCSSFKIFKDDMENNSTSSEDLDKSSRSLNKELSDLGQQIKLSKSATELSVMSKELEGHDVSSHVLKMAEYLKGGAIKGLVTDIEKDTMSNKNFRKVLYTGKNSQLVLMSLIPGQDIGEETHDVDQFFRVDSGSGKAIIDGKESSIKDGSAIVIPACAKHNIINSGKEDLKLYSIYSPPHHADGTIHKTKDDAESADENFDGKTTEKLATDYDHI